MKLIVSGCSWVLPSADSDSAPIPDADIVIDDGVITQIRPSSAPTGGTTVVDARGCIAIPGLVNAHHHMFQSLTRTVAHDRELFGWLSSLWPRWSRHDAEWQYAATRLACAELLLSGCTTAADHHYLAPASGDAIAAEAAAAGSLGIRLMQGIGSMDIDDQHGGIAPHQACEDAERYLKRAGNLIRDAQDGAPASRRRIALAPCHPLAVSADYVRGSIELARASGVRLHTHSAEGRDEERATVAATGFRPIELLEEWGLLGTDVWLAHAVHLSDADIETLARTGTCVATCPSSNLRLGSGIARVRDMLDAGVTVGLGVDGSASNDAGNLLGEARQLLLTSRASGIEHGLSAREALTIATSGGAQALGWPGVGKLHEGYRADIAVFPLNGLASVGTESDPVAALLLSPPTSAQHVIVDGEVVVENKRLVHADIDDIVEQARAVIRRIL